jgi:hypothetical protein
VVEIGGVAAGKKFVTARECGSLSECNPKRTAQKHLVHTNRIEGGTAVTCSGDTQFESRSSRRYYVCVFGSLFHSFLDRI